VKRRLLMPVEVRQDEAQKNQVSSRSKQTSRSKYKRAKYAASRRWAIRNRELDREEGHHDGNDD